MKQEPRPAYHRRQDLLRLQALLDESFSPLRLSDEAGDYVLKTSAGELVFKGRHQVVHAYLCGWRDAIAYDR